MLFAIIAHRDVSFFLKVAYRIKKVSPSIDIKFISFYQPGNKLIRKSGFECFDLYEYLNNYNYELPSVKELEKKYSIENMQKLLLHEKLTFAEYNTSKLLKKFMAYLSAIDRIIIHAVGTNPKEALVVQELGGFIAPLALYFVSRKYNIDHIFIEPAFFRGRLHNVLNSLAPIHFPDDLPDEIDDEVVNYIDKTIQLKAIVIPEKDRHHFLDMTLRKIINTDNIKKLYLKLKYKYINNYKQEYEHIFNHVERYIYMYINRKITTNLYSPFSDDLKNKTYIYFPFHVQLDYALTIRSPEYLNQLAFVEYVCSMLPANVYLLVKEHPASIGGFKYSDLRRLLKRNDNLRLIHPGINSFDITKHSSAVLTINSKAGAEALALGKAVIVMGQAFYSNSKCVHFVDKIASLSSIIKNVLQNDTKNLEKERLKMFTYLWNQSYPAELYNLNDNNIVRFVDGILTT